jgi:hypothetical protein
MVERYIGQHNDVPAISTTTALPMDIPMIILADKVLLLFNTVHDSELHSR